MGFSGANDSKKTTMGKKSLGANDLWGQTISTCPREWWSLEQAWRAKAKEELAFAEQNQTLHHDPSQPTIPVPRGVRHYP